MSRKKEGILANNADDNSALYVQSDQDQPSFNNTVSRYN